MPKFCIRAGALAAPAALAVLAAGVALADDAPRSHAAHVHGVAEVNVVRAGDELFLELQSPTVNLVGFEHRPVSVEDRARADQLRVLLSDPGVLFGLPEAAACRVVGADLELPWEEEDAGPAGAHHTAGGAVLHDHDRDDGHTDVRAEYRLRCERPAALSVLRTALFERFPMMQRLNVQYVTGDDQGATVLTADRPELAF